MSETAWAYLVVSSSLQADTLEHQADWARKTCEAQGWDLLRTFSATATGKRGVRKLLVQLVNELKAIPPAERPTRVLMLRLDRIGRGSIVESQVALRELKMLGVVVHTRDGGDQRLDGAMDELIAAAKFAVASFENDVKAEKMRAVHARWRTEGRHFGPPPYGTAKDEQQRLIVREPQATFVRRAFELRATGAGYIRISREIGRYAPPQGTYAGNPRSSTWHQQSVSKLLACRSYRGLVVPEELFDRVQGIRNPDWRLTRATRAYPWPLSGVIVCWCGWTMTGVAGGRQGARIRYYACRHPRYHAEEHRPSLRADGAEAWFVHQLTTLVASPELLEASSRRSVDEQVSGLRKTLAADKAELDDLERQRKIAWGLQSDGRIAAGELAQRLDELREARDAVANRMSDTEQELAVVVGQAAIAADAQAILDSAATKWSGASPDDQKEIARLVSSLLEGLYFCTDGVLRFGVDEGLPTDEPFTRRRRLYRQQSARLSFR